MAKSERTAGMMYTEKVMEHFMNPRNVGEIKNPDGVGTVGNPVCLKPGSLIHTNSKVQEIESLAEGTRVLSHDGQYHQIEKIYQRNYKGKIYGLRIHNLGQLELTDDHLILAKKIAPFRYKKEASKKSIAEWFSAKELEKGDFILFPVPKAVINKEEIDFDEARPEWDFTSKNLPGRIQVNADFLTIVGFYLSEGYVRTDPSKGTVGFVFGSTEEKYGRQIISLVKKTFNLSPGQIVCKANSVHIPFYSARLARFFEKNFGKGAENKKLPQWAMDLSPNKQRELIYGLWHGDGYITDSVAKFVTISRQLAYQLQLLLLRQNIISSFLTFQAKDIHKKHYALFIKNQESLGKLADILKIKLNFSPKKKNPQKTWFDENYYYAPIWKVESYNYEGLVYNLEVGEARSYVAEAATVHNCGDVMQMFIRVKDNKITDIKFKTFGCGAAIATSSMVTEMVKGKSLDEAVKVSNKMVAEALGGLPPQKMHCSNLAADGVQSAINDYFSKDNKKSKASAGKGKAKEKTKG